MKKTINSLLILFLVLFASCAEKSQKPIIELPKTDHRADFNQFFASNRNSILSDKINEIKIDSLHWLENFYKNINYSTLWISDSITLNNDGSKLLETLSDANAYGLDTRLYPINELRAIHKEIEQTEDKTSRYALLGRLEALLSYQYMRFGRHLNYGVLDSINEVSILPRKKFDINLPEYLQIAYEKDSLIEKLIDLQPKQPEYRNLQKGLAKFLKHSSLSTESVQVVNFRQDSLKAVAQAKKALILHNYLPEEYKDSLYNSALEKFQLDHGLKADGLIGTNTANALSLSPYEYYQQIKASLERWRWKDNWPSDYLFVNIPSYQLRVVNDNKVSKKFNVVVGSVKNQTPEIIDSLQYIIAYPYWNVPKKISVQEILVKAKRDSTYLTRNKYEVIGEGSEKIDPTTVDWSEVNRSNFNYRFRQQGGGINALGYVKFIFPNKDAIYLHDTPSKSHFNREIRAYSHGCIRVQNALDLADYLLEKDNNRFTMDTVRTYIKKKKEKWMPMKKNLPVFLYYISVEADSDGKITFYKDIYKEDKKLIRSLAINAK
ncbi:L,D-transpeptidase family protein [Aureibaculum sp. 2210JD6-5]|uniref:L,D-transpeptidase family protein n=1 Tax=Aureibaculum sp. 2210JD6-5 TaxID=3103957 RepID=UPI002AACCC30|nr:L,D-transpeptidase family protein [Aureibaculum sp. 2210JD6-5]MDY7395496.1 L,D-transpeptidase family protein [Aureibaculum sp. 2210JD6-5]